eukprot:CAMPEP_0181499070 /NCGR_PEP_ID=MMETSP1110-20121109/54452_1 /TAXON_ID=174948 /ORGANISM="Symbiodinium sp., Strain CCMP421" /LENGTH=124 /DNA_ID=CAMNT_0023627211 /DNA_START=38 /DNA_END=408 /DNA_ORIENTATION=-
MHSELSLASSSFGMFVRQPETAHPVVRREELAGVWVARRPGACKVLGWGEYTPRCPWAFAMRLRVLHEEFLIVGGDDGFRQLAVPPVAFKRGLLNRSVFCWLLVTCRVAGSHRSLRLSFLLQAA